MMNHHVPPHHHAMRNEPNPYMQPPHYPNAHPMPTPQQRSMMNPAMEPGYQMNNQQPSHVQMMHPSKCFAIKIRPISMSHNKGANQNVRTQGNGSHPPMPHMHGGPMPPHANMQMNGSSAIRGIHQM